MRERTSGPVLIVDDDPYVRQTLREIFVSSGYRCRLATNGLEALDAFTLERPPLTVTDVKMPVMDGLEFVRRVHALDPDAMLLVLTGVADVKTAVESLTGGAYDLILKPVTPQELLQAAQRALEHGELLARRREEHEALRHRVAEATRELGLLFRQLEETYRSTLEALGSAIDTRDVCTHSHSRRVWACTLIIARAHGMPEQDLRDLEHGVLLHDIGKIGIPDSILLKPGPLTGDEWTVMQKHPGIGRQIIEKIPFLKGAMPVVYHHHERWDGTGYPLGLRGEAIPLAARIFAVVDAFDAMTFDRPYSKAITIQAARQEIQRCAGTHFDPAVVATFLTIPVHVLTNIQRATTEEPNASGTAKATILVTSRARAEACEPLAAVSDVGAANDNN
jgi:response regulator RpfG family c-di-GMP phosphodiesterase